MAITLEQARALDALARAGTFSRAAELLHKRHTAVLYGVRTLEEQTGLVLLDRRAYRTKLTAVGERVLAHARRLLAAERELEAACAEIKTGWEPELAIVFDGIFPVQPLLEATVEIARAGASTRVDVSSEFLAGVEKAFLERDATLMISVLPPSSPELRAVKLAPIRALLVARSDHPLSRESARRVLEPADLASHVLLTVRGSDPRLHLSTAGIEPPIAVRLNDFHAKRDAIVGGLGFGWLPEPMVQGHLAKKALAVLRWRQASEHVLSPRLYFRRHEALGRAARIVVDRLRLHARHEPASRA